MSRSTQAGRRRAEQIRIAAERARVRRRRLLIAAVGVALPLVLVAVMVIVRISRPPSAVAAVESGLASDAVVSALVVPPSILDTVGRGSVTTLPARLPAAEPALLEGGRPLVLYVGAEYCPFCAAQRWGLVVALTRFGTFHGLRSAGSAVDDVFPATATVSFHGATYESQYLTFAGVELATSERRGGTYEPLDTLTAAQSTVFRKYNAPPYVSAELAGAVPFVDFGNRFVMSGSTFSPSLLAGLNHEQIAAALADPAGPVGRAVLGSANAFTTILCGLTNNQPATVCAGPAVTAFPEVARGNA